MQNYVALYGFLRTICLLAILLWWFALWSAFQSPHGGWVSTLDLLWTAILAYLLFMAFMKFYRRFSLEVYMGLTAVKAAA